MLMRTHYGRIDHGVFIVGIGRQRLENALPDAVLAPPGVPRMDHAKIPETFRQIAPWDQTPSLGQFKLKLSSWFRRRYGCISASAIEFAVSGSWVRNKRAPCAPQ